MGRYILLITFAGMLGTSLLMQQGRQTRLETTEQQGKRQGVVIARQIARSAFSDGMSEVKRNFGSIADRTQDGPYEKGTYALKYDVSTNAEGDRIVQITATGTYRDASYQMRGTALEKTSVRSLFNGITAGTPITFNVSGGGCSGAACVSGIDLGGGDDRHGISLPPDGDADAACNEFGGKVEGKGPGCDVYVRTDDEDAWVQEQLDVLESEIQGAQDADDVTVCDGNCRLKDLPRSSGVLYITGDLTIGGSRQWDGLVFVGSGGSVRINGGGDVENINGSLVMESVTDLEQEEDLDMNGGNAIQYNSSTLLDYVGTIPSITTTTIQVTERSESLLSE